MHITFRPITDNDREFLYRVYASTRLEELAPAQWSEQQVTAFLTMQFNAQHSYYQEQFPDASYQIVLLDGQPIGRLYLDHRADNLEIIDIALLTEYRNRGIGSRLLNDVIAQGEREGLPIQIYVERNNPALRLYHRLGFHQIGETGIYLFMQRPIGALPRNSAQPADSNISEGH